MTPDEKSVIVANALSDSLTFIDPRTAEVQREVRGILDPYHLRFSPDMKWFVTAANRLNHVDIYRWDGRDMTLAKRHFHGQDPEPPLESTARARTVCPPCRTDDELVAIDLTTQALKWRVKTGPMPADVFGTPDDKTVLVGLTGGDGVEVYDVSGKEGRLVKTIKTGKGAHSFRAFGDGRHVLVSNRVANTISKIDYQKMEVVDHFPGPAGPRRHGHLGRRQDDPAGLALGTQAHGDRHRHPHRGAPDQRGQVPARGLDAGPCPASIGDRACQDSCGLFAGCWSLRFS
jgi:DNA-binding beta-propeller fold protein YncE